mmetsp:Transcript_11298/g.29842  ORF Transcript_11298/g.29842 Transcript_11298/m.29842 type:complete len:96 (+) Transcript_11298:295-582(+)
MSSSVTPVITHTGVIMQAAVALSKNLTNSSATNASTLASFRMHALQRGVKSDFSTLSSCGVTLTGIIQNAQHSSAQQKVAMKRLQRGRNVINTRR